MRKFWFLMTMGAFLALVGAKVSQAEDAPDDAIEVIAPIEVQTVEKPTETQQLVETVGEWTTFVSALGAAKGLTVFGGVGMLVQFLMLVLKTHNVLKTPKQQLGAVTAMSVALGWPTLQAVGGLDAASALVHSGTLAALQVYGNQIFKKFTAPKGPF